MIQSVFFSLMFCALVFAEDAVQEAELEILPPSVEVEDFTGDHFLSELKGLTICMQEIPQIERVENAQETIGALMATRIEFQHCIFKAEAVIADARAWQGAIECAKDRGRVLSGEVSSSEPQAVSPLMAQLLLLTPSGVESVPDESSSERSEKDSLDQLTEDAQIIVSALLEMHAMLVLVRDTIDARVLQLRTQDALKSIPDVLETLP
jgi:hypothetical protein